MVVDPLIESRDVSKYSGDPRVPRDGEMIDGVLEAVRQPAGEGITMIVVTHGTGFARPAAHRVVLTADGRAVEERTPEKSSGDPDGDRAEDFLPTILKH
ncbi:hypothetical protein [Streptomyces sp. NPDC016626]|uniref:hypothetical protein n=1 Tax=Streptomyces sp. NPDC016626 TaxID=3364968 RepID=UPI003700BA2C